MVSPLFTAFALIACGRVEVPPAPRAAAAGARDPRLSSATRTTRLTGRRRRGARARGRAWLADHRQAGRAGLDAGRRRGQARAARGRLCQGQGRPWRHARSARQRACCRSRSARRPSSPGGCSTPTRSMSSRSRFGEETDTLDAEGEVVATSRQAADAGRGRGGAAALHRRDRAGAAGLFGAQGRRQARLRSGAGRRGGRAEEPAGDDPFAPSCEPSSSSVATPQDADEPAASDEASPSPPASPRAPTSARSPATSPGRSARSAMSPCCGGRRPGRSPSNGRFRWTNWTKSLRARTLEQHLLPLTAGLDDIPALPVTPDQAGALRQGRTLIGIAAQPGLHLATDRRRSGRARGASAEGNFGWCAASTCDLMKELTMSVTAERKQEDHQGQCPVARATPVRPRCRSRS